MKRPLIVTIGIVVILLVLGVWVYLLFFGTPSEVKEVPANLGFDFTPREAEVIEPVEEGYRVDTSFGLQQLTTRPVAGFISITSTTSSSTIVRYVEQGTGHIYDIKLDTGEETLASRTTIPRVREAVFSPNGEFVAITSYTSYDRDTYFGKIETDQTLKGENIIPNAKNIKVLDNQVINYTIEGEDGLTGYTYDLASRQLSEKFKLPFNDVEILWNDNSTYAFNRPAISLLGYMYKINAGSYETTAISGYGLVAESSDSFIGYSELVDGEYLSYLYNPVDGTTYPSPVLITKSKCDFSNVVETEKIWCAAPTETADFNLIDWYQGESLVSDYLWEISVKANRATLIGYLERDSGRPIDVKDTYVNADNSLMLFTNKLDNSLWKFDL